MEKEKVVKSKKEKINLTT